MTIGVQRGLLQRIRCPRAVATGFARGVTVGPAGDHATQRRVLTAALDLLTTATAETLIDRPADPAVDVTPERS